jgi:putative two-component system response regulator
MTALDSKVDADLFNAKILVVDDESANVILLERLLGSQGFRHVRGVTDPREAVEIYRAERQDLVLLDLRMPHMSGMQVMAELNALEAGSYAPVLVMTAETDRKTRLEALQGGAKDFVTKPYDHLEVLSRIRSQLEVRLLHKRLESNAAHLEEMVKQRTEELFSTRLEVVRRLGRAAEYRDNETGLHIIRMSKMSAALAKRSGMSPAECDLILNASPMHDIGKIGVPDAVLLKPGKLDASEWEKMKLHPTIGSEILSGHDSDLMNMACDIARCHHEKWDGSGYPAGLAGTDIPLAARIIAIADVFDALTSDRPYKKAWSVADALAEMERMAGTHFDPQLMKCFLDVMPEVHDIMAQYAEPDGLSHLHRLSDNTATV